MTKAEKIVYYAEQQIHHGSIYVWGGQGEKVKTLTLLKLCQMENSADNAGRVVKYVYNNRMNMDSKAKVYDCSGLVCKALEYAKVVASGFDTNAQGLYLKYDKIPVGKRRMGDLVFKFSSGVATHVGIVFNEDYVIEAKGRDYGVVKTKFDSSWTACNRPVG